MKRCALIFQLLNLALLLLGCLLRRSQVGLGGCQCSAGLLCTCVGLFGLVAQLLSLYLGLEPFLFQLYLQSLLLGCSLRPLLL